MRVFAILFAVFVAALILLTDLGYLRVLLYIIHRIPLADKAVHFFVMGLLTFFVAASLLEAFPSRSPLWVTAACMFFFAVVFTVEEISQGPIRGRDASLEDLAANYAGILFFGCLAWLRNRKRAATGVSN